MSPTTPVARAGVLRIREPRAGDRAIAFSHTREQMALPASDGRNEATKGYD